MEEDVIRQLRKELYYELKDYIGEKPRHLAQNMDIKYRNELIFNIDEDGRKTFVFSPELMKKVNLEDMSFDGFDVRGYDFTGFTGVNIDPQKAYKKDISFSNLKDVNLTGSLEGVITDGAIHKGMVVDFNVEKDRVK